jgi:hypothetical protein
MPSTLGRGRDTQQTGNSPDKNKGSGEKTIKKGRRRFIASTEKKTESALPQGTGTGAVKTPMQLLAIVVPENCSRPTKLGRTLGNGLDRNAETSLFFCLYQGCETGLGKP